METILLNLFLKKNKEISFKRIKNSNPIKKGKEVKIVWNRACVIFIIQKIILNLEIKRSKTK